MKTKISLRIKPEDYGSTYNQHLLEQYKIYIQMADNVSERRNKANTFFLTANSFLVATLGIGARLNAPMGIDTFLIVIAAVSGILFAVTWFVTIYSYRKLIK
jgi:hypothetical protein